MNDNDLTKEVRQRIKSVLSDKNVSVNAISSLIGIQQVTLNRQLNGDFEVSLRTIQSLLNSDLNISAEWLLRGEGPMYKDGSGATCEVNEDERVPEKEVLLVPAGARGGSLDHFETEVGLNPYNAEVIRSPFINADFAWAVKDDSMAPGYPAGTVLFVKRLKTSIIKWGNSYIFDTDDGFQFAKLRRSELGEDYIRCVFINENDYEPYDVPKAEIHGIYKVLGAMRW